MEILFNHFFVLFIVIDPVGLAPMFAALTRGADRAYQKRMAVRGTTLACIIILTFYFVGDWLLGMLGISLPAFRIAGGALLFLLAIDMVFARQSGLRSTTIREQQEAEMRNDISVFPVAFPLISGPGALTTALLMASSAHAPLVFYGTVLIILVVLALTLLSLLSAPFIMRLMGETGANVISRLFGLILSALAIQFVLDGIRLSLIGQS